MGNTSTGFLAIVGRPNVGKSSLTNRLVGRKVAIVSDKPQTTRTRIMGVYTEGETQLVFLDTPGQHRSRNRLDDFMRRSIGEALSEIEGCLLVTSPDTVIHDEEKELLRRLQKDGTPTLLAINKIDTLADKSSLLACIDMWQKAFPFAGIWPISAKTGDGVPALLEQLKGYAVEGPHFFPDDAVSDQPEQILASELIREKLLHLLQQEVPHGIAVGIERYEERDTVKGDPILDIDAVIYCERDSHKGIIIGKRGSMLRAVGVAARTELEQLLGIRVNLQCFVKVKEDWRNRPSQLSQFGYRL